MEAVTRAFARVIDAKSPWTARHSDRVARLSQSMAGMLGLSPEDELDLVRAAMLHEIGMLCVSSRILE